MVTLIGNEACSTFNNLGWITDGGNTTAGNNTRPASTAMASMAWTRR